MRFLVLAFTCFAAFAQEPEPLSETAMVYRSLEYADSPRGPMRLNLYSPRHVEGPLPAIVVIQGGGFRAQPVDRFGPESQHFAEQGFIAASICYRGTPDDQFPSTVHDAKAAVRFLRANAARFNTDPDRIGAFGHSAGGYLVQMLAVTGGMAEFEGDGGNPGVSSAVQAAVSSGGVSDFIERLRDGGHQSEQLEEKRASNGAWIGEPFAVDSALWKKASPVTYVSAAAAPMLLIHGTNDRTVSYLQSQLMHDALTAAGAASELRLLDGVGHGVRRPDHVRETVLDAVIAFFRAHLKAP